MRAAIIVALALALPALPPAAAQAQNQVGRRDPVTIEPDRAYIFYRSPRRQTLMFLRETAGRPHVPVEPENKAEGKPADDDFWVVSRTPTFTSEEGAHSYLAAVEPGSYVLYAQRDQAGNFLTGVCLCMGSIRFEARAGQIVDLGTVTYPRMMTTGRAPTGIVRTPTGVPSIAVVPPDPSASLPERLAGQPVVAAEYRAAGKMPNYHLLYIDRHPAMPGVLGYQRDRVIDLRTEQEATAPASPD